MLDATTFGLWAGVFQFAGYVAYYLLVVRNPSKKPEPLTWFMFAYGTALLTVMEFDTMVNEAAVDSSWRNIVSVILLPVVCSIGGIGVAIIMWRRNFASTQRLWLEEWKVDWSDTDGKAFAVDIGITIGYSTLWFVGLFGVATGHAHSWLVVAFLVASNLTTFPNFIPILRQAWHHPEKEDARPWTIWAIAYALLLVPTASKGSEDVIWATSFNPLTWDVSFCAFLSLMSYPAINTVMHGLMAIFAALPASKTKGEAMNPAE